MLVITRGYRILWRILTQRLRFFAARWKVREKGANWLISATQHDTWQSFQWKKPWKFCSNQNGHWGDLETSLFFLHFPYGNRRCLGDFTGSWGELLHYLARGQLDPEVLAARAQQRVERVRRNIQLAFVHLWWYISIHFTVDFGHIFGHFWTSCSTWMIIWRMIYGKYFSMDGHGWLVCNCLSSGAIPFGSGSEFRIMISY